MGGHADTVSLVNGVYLSPDEQEQIFVKSPVGMVIYNSEGQCIAANEAAAISVGASRKQLLEQNYYTIESWKKSGLLDAAQIAVKEGKTIRKEIKVHTTFEKFAGLDCYLVPLASRKLLLMINDVTEKILMRENVKELCGLLPICSVCKKIRDDSGYWKQLELYISQHSSAEFSHSLCPVCLETLYPECADD